jgi:hypothetical protein
MHNTTNCTVLLKSTTSGHSSRRRGDIIDMHGVHDPTSDFAFLRTNTKSFLRLRTKNRNDTTVGIYPLKEGRHEDACPRVDLLSKGR